MSDAPQQKPRKPARQRADLLLVERGLVESREQAQALIMAGAVLSPAGPVQKAGSFLAPDTPLELRERLPYVSRGGVKLAHALDTWAQPHAIPSMASPPWTLARPPAGSPIACSSAARPAFTPSTSDAANCITGCGRTRG